jgi:nitrite reductase (NO-forming)
MAHSHRIALALIMLATTSGLTAAERTFTLEAHMTGYVGTEGDLKGKRNPTLTVDSGDTVKLILLNAEPMAHDITLESHQVHSTQVLRIGDRAELTFVAQKSDVYYCSIPGHRQIGMEGRLEVKGGAASEDTAGSVASLHAPMSAAAIEPARAVTVAEIGADPTAVPAPITRKEAAVVPVRITASEEIAALADGTTFEYWCYNKQVPGPLVRCRVGDTVDVTFANDAKSRLVHSIDFHAASGPGGGAKYLQVAPGQEKELRFKALVPGLYIYHCATPHIPSHLSHGMYGMVLVEPEAGLPKVDREFYVMQGDFYTSHKPGTKGHMAQDDQRLFEEQPTFICMNGRVGSLTGDRTMKAKVGESVRILFGVGGPNLTCSFHVIGEIFDHVYREGDLISTPAQGVQTTMVPSGGATVVDFTIDTAGTYLLVDHSLSRLDKGNVGLLKAEGEDRPEIITLAK